MPQTRHYENAAQRQAAYRQRQAQAHAAQLRQKGLPPLPAVSTMPGQARWTALLEQAQWALAQVSREMQEYYDERSAAWQESERGADFAQRLEAVQEVLEGLTELAAADTKKSAKTLDGPPQMSGWPAVGTNLARSRTEQANRMDSTYTAGVGVILTIAVFMMDWRRRCIIVSEASQLP